MRSIRSEFRSGSFPSGNTLVASTPKHAPGPCIWCGQWVEDGREISGATDPNDPAWHDDGDFGCEGNPLTGDDGVGGHARISDVRRWYLERIASPDLFLALESIEAGGDPESSRIAGDAIRSARKEIRTCQVE